MGFLDRLRGGGLENATSRTTLNQHFNIKVPQAHATAVQAALEQWAQSKGWAAVVGSERDGDYVKFSIQHDETLAGKPPDLSTGKLTDELQKILEDALKKPEST